MDIRKVKKLIEMLEESNLTEIEIVEGEESVRLSRGGNYPVPQPAPQYVVQAPASAPPPVPVSAPAYLVPRQQQSLPPRKDEVPEG